MKARVDTSKFQKRVMVPTPDGPKEYIFEILHRKDAAKAFHNTLISIASALGSAIGSDPKNIGAQDLLRAVSALDFDSVWDLACIFLKGCVINGVEIPDLEESDYFQDKNLELYSALWSAINANFPSVFSLIRERIKGSAFAEMAKKAMSDAVSGTPSKEG